MSRKRRSRRYKDSSRVIDMNEARRKRQVRHRARRPEPETARNSGRKLKRDQELKKQQVRRRLIVAAVIVIVAALFGASVFNIIRLKKEENQLLQQQQQLQEEKEQLEDELKNRDDDEAVEDEARSKLNMIKPGETMYAPEDEVQDQDQKDGEN